MRTLQEHIKIFDLIAGIYNLFYPLQRIWYRKVLSAGEKSVPWDQVHDVLDVGCGTGAFASLWADSGCNVVGADASAKMVNRARRNTRSYASVKIIQANAVTGLPFEDNSFDLAFCSYVAHGLSRKHRLQLYREMCRVSRIMIIIHDYSPKRSIMIDAVETLEGGDYFNFIQNVHEEMNSHICSLKVLPVGKRSSWYICTKEGTGEVCRIP